MKMDEYQLLASRTASTSNLEVVVGLPEEVGEVIGAIKKHLFHGHDLNRDKLVKELGDVLWYLSMVAKIFGINMSEVAECNIEKLKKRYPNGFSEKDSINRKE